MPIDDYLDEDTKEVASNNPKKKFVRITKEQFEDFLDNYWFDWELVENRPDSMARELSFSGEYVCMVDLDDRTNLGIVIFSTIRKSDGKARDKGSDAIRTVIWDDKQKAIIGGRKKTLRIETWRNNLIKKIRDLQNNWDGYVTNCEECGGWLVKREGKHGKFLGCTEYPNCTNTQKYNE